MKRSLFANDPQFTVMLSFKEWWEGIFIMAKGKLSIFLCTLAVAVGCGMTGSKADDRGEECKGTPMDAVMMLPSPLRKGGQINCTPFGHALVSRDGWVWASLD